MKNSLFKSPIAHSMTCICFILIILGAFEAHAQIRFGITSEVENERAFTAVDAFNLDQANDDGIPNTGTIIAIGDDDCFQNGSYTLDSRDSRVCDLTIRILLDETETTNTDASSCSGATLGTTRKSNSLTCPDGTVGWVTESCQEVNGNAVWRANDFSSCRNVTCDNGSRPDVLAGGTREVSCPTGYNGTYTQQCTEAGSYRNTSTIGCTVADTICSTEGERRTIACPVGELGGRQQICRSGIWTDDSARSDCAEIKCSPVAGCSEASVGEICKPSTSNIPTIAACPSPGYVNPPTQSPTLTCNATGNWQVAKTHCTPEYLTEPSQDCEANETRESQILCPPGEGGVIQDICVVNSYKDNQGNTVEERFWVLGGNNRCAQAECGEGVLGSSREVGACTPTPVTGRERVGTIIDICSEVSAGVFQWVRDETKCVEVSDDVCPAISTSSAEHGYAAWPESSINESQDISFLWCLGVDTGLGHPTGSSPAALPNGVTTITRRCVLNPTTGDPEWGPVSDSCVASTCAEDTTPANLALGYDEITWPETIYHVNGGVDYFNNNIASDWGKQSFGVYPDGALHRNAFNGNESDLVTHPCADGFSGHVYRICSYDTNSSHGVGQGEWSNLLVGCTPVPDNACPEETIGGWTWPKTPPSEHAKIPCGSAYTGDNWERFCEPNILGQGVWYGAGVTPGTCTADFNCPTETTNVANVGAVDWPKSPVPTSHLSHGIVGIDCPAGYAGKLARRCGNATEWPHPLNPNTSSEDTGGEWEAIEHNCTPCQKTPGLPKQIVVNAAGSTTSSIFEDTGIDILPQSIVHFSFTGTWFVGDYNNQSGTSSRTGADHCNSLSNYKPNGFDLGVLRWAVGNSDRTTCFPYNSYYASGQRSTGIGPDPHRVTYPPYQGKYYILGSDGTGRLAFAPNDDNRSGIESGYLTINITDGCN